MGALRVICLLWFWGILLAAFFILALVGLGRYGWADFRHEMRRRRSL